MPNEGITCDLLMNRLMLVCLVSSRLTSTHLSIGSPPERVPDGKMASKGGCLKTPFCDWALLLTKSAVTPVLGRPPGRKPSKSAGLVEPVPASTANQMPSEFVVPLPVPTGTPGLEMDVRQLQLVPRWFIPKRANSWGK